MYFQYASKSILEVLQNYETSAEQAGIKLDLGQNKIESLIKLVSKDYEFPI